MAENKNKQATWTEVKAVLSKMRREELLGTIDALYKLRKENKQFLHTRFQLGEGILDDYKLQISKGVNPVKGQISFRNARQAISEYKKASGDLDGLAELMVYYCKECANAIKKFGVWEQYADATMNIWQDTLKHLTKLSKNKQIHYWKELASAQNIMGDVGWGLSDYVSDIMYEYSPIKEEEEEATLDVDDMW